MNQMQIKHIRQRLTEMLVKKEKKIRTSFVKKEANPLTLEKLQKEFKEGTLKLRKKKLHGNYPSYLNDFFDLSHYSHNITYDLKKQEKALNTLKEMYSRTLDELIIGDSEEALRLLAEFDKYEV